MAKRPSFQFYPGDWLRDSISGCSLAAQGLWLRMMIIAHDCHPYGELRLEGAPMPHAAIARRCGCTVEEYERLYGELTRSGVPSQKPDGTIFCRRMVRDEKIRKIREKAGKKGGNPCLKKNNNGEGLQILVNQNPTTGVNQKPTPSSSSSKKNINTLRDSPNPAVRIFIEAFAKSFQERFAQPYHVNRAKDGTLVRRLLTTHSLEKLLEFQRNFFLEDDEFLRKAGYTIGIFFTRINKLAQGKKRNPLYGE